MKLAIDNDYFVCVIQDKPNVLKAIYPKNKELNLKDDVFTYYFYKNELFVSIDKKSKSLNYLDYELRPFVIGHILLTSIDRHIPPKYIKGYNSKNIETKMADLLPEPHLKSKEKILMVKLMRFLEERKINGKDMARNIQRFKKFYEEKYD